MINIRVYHQWDYEKKLTITWAIFPLSKGKVVCWNKICPRLQWRSTMWLCHQHHIKSGNRMLVKFLCAFPLFYTPKHKTGSFILCNGHVLQKKSKPWTWLPRFPAQNLGIASQGQVFQARSPGSGSKERLDQHLMDESVYMCFPRWRASELQHLFTMILARLSPRLSGPYLFQWAP